MTDLFAYPHAPGAQDRDTSLAAADSAAETAPLLRARALAVLERSNGLTADQVAARLSLSILSIRPRCTELSRLGKIRDSGERRPERLGADGDRLDGGAAGTTERAGTMSDLHRQVTRAIERWAFAQIESDDPRRADVFQLVSNRAAILADVALAAITRTSASGIPITRRRT